MHNAIGYGVGRKNYKNNLYVQVDAAYLFMGVLLPLDFFLAKRPKTGFLEIKNAVAM